MAFEAMAAFVFSGFGSWAFSLTSCGAGWADLPTPTPHQFGEHPGARSHDCRQRPSGPGTEVAVWLWLPSAPLGASVPLSAFSSDRPSALANEASILGGRTQGWVPGLKANPDSQRPVCLFPGQVYRKFPQPGSCLEPGAGP